MKNFSQKFWGISQGPRYYTFMENTRHQKSYASVPLTKTNPKQCAKLQALRKDIKYCTKKTARKHDVMLPVFFMFSIVFSLNFNQRCSLRVSTKSIDTELADECRVANVMFFFTITP